MDTETTKIIATSAIQLFLGVGAWFFGWRIASSQLDTRKSELRARLFDERYSIYQAFEEFLRHCTCYEPCHPEALTEFREKTSRVDFLFGHEIRKYRRQIIANALAFRGMREGLPCEDGPVIGGIVGYFKGSTNLESIPEIQAWFATQIEQDLHAFFAPYLDYGLAGVDTKLMRMNPPDLPEPPLVRRPTSYRPEPQTDEPCDSHGAADGALTNGKSTTAAR